LRADAETATAAEREAPDPELEEASSSQIGKAHPGTWPYDGACLSSPPEIRGKSEARSIKPTSKPKSKQEGKPATHALAASTSDGKVHGASALKAPQLETFAGAQQPTGKRKATHAASEDHQEDATLAGCPPAPAASSPSSSVKMPAGAGPVTLKPPAVGTPASKPNAFQHQISCTLCNMVFSNRNALQA
jgi:hypothetical protein